MNKTSIFAATLLTLVVSAARAQITYWDPISGGNGHYYEPIVAPGGNISWDNAKLAAESKGGYLATLTSAAESGFVFSLIDSAAFWQSSYLVDSDTTNNNGPLLGGFQPGGSTEPDGGWQWVNGEGLLSATYANWAPGQPNDILGGQNALWFWASAPGNVTAPRLNQWDDLHGFIGGPSYVIEYNTTPVPEPAACTVVVGASLLACTSLLRLRQHRKATCLVEAIKFHFSKGRVNC